jgi:hypothetical protein
LGEKHNHAIIFFCFKKAMSSDSTPPPPAAAAAEEHTESGASGEELEALQERISSLTSTFATSYAGLVGNLKHSVDMMQRINGIMEAYVVNALQMRVSLHAAPSTCALHVVNRCQFDLHDVAFVLALLPEDDTITGDEPPTPLARLRAPHDRLWRAPRLAACTEAHRDPFQLPAAAVCTYMLPERAPAPCSLVVMARFASPASTHQLEARTVVPYPIACQLARSIADASLLTTGGGSSAVSTFTIEGERWRRLFAVSPMRGLSAVRDWYRFSLHSNHNDVVAECRIVAHDLSAGELTVHLVGAAAHAELAKHVLAELSAPTAVF